MSQLAIYPHVSDLDERREAEACIHERQKQIIVAYQQIAFIESATCRLIRTELDDEDCELQLRFRIDAQLFALEPTRELVEARTHLMDGLKRISCVLDLVRSNLELDVDDEHGEDVE